MKIVPFPDRTNRCRLAQPAVLAAAVQASARTMLGLWLVACFVGAAQPAMALDGANRRAHATSGDHRAQHAVSHKPAPSTSEASSPRPTVSSSSTAAKRPVEAESAPRAAQSQADGSVNNLRALLLLLGVDAPQMAAFADGALDPAAVESPPLWQLLYAVRRLRPWDMQRFALPAAALNGGVLEPRAYWGGSFSLTGRVTRVELRSVPADVAQRLEFKTYYRCVFQPREVSMPAGEAIVFAREVPKAWQLDKAVDYRVGVDGVLATALKRKLPSAPSAVAPVLVACRVAWYPPGILGDLKVDVGLFDRIEDRRPILKQEREPFYQMLAACARAEEGLLDRMAGDTTYSVVPLFNEPAHQRGRLVALRGTAVSALAVRVEEPDIRQRFGLRQYFEVVMFTDDSQQNPIVFCVPRLPEGMPQGEEIFERVRIAGFFFKAWAYPRAAGDRKVRQIAPLLIGQTPRWYPVEQRGRGGLLVGLLFVLGLLVLWLIVWRVNRGDSAAFRRRLAEKYGTPPAKLTDVPDVADFGPSHDLPEPSPPSE